MKSAVTISLVPEARGGPFIFWDDLAAGCEQAVALGFDAVEIFPASAGALNVSKLARLLEVQGLKCAAIGTGGGWVKQRLRLTDPDAAAEYIRVRDEPVVILRVGILAHQRDRAEAARLIAQTRIRGKALVIGGEKGA